MTRSPQNPSLPSQHVAVCAGLLWWMTCSVAVLQAAEPTSAETIVVSDASRTGARPITPPKSRDARGAISPRNARPESAWWTTLGGLATVLALLGGTAWVVRKNLPTVPKGLPKSVVEVLGRRSLEPRAAIHLVRCGSRILVLGTTPQGMVSLAEITDAAEVDFVSGLCRAEDEASQHSFLDLVGKFRRGDDPRLDEPEPTDRFANPNADDSIGERAVAPITAGPDRRDRFDGPDPAASRLKHRMASDRRRSVDDEATTEEASRA
jgi:flagellar biogenesis protein FliO